MIVRWISSVVFEFLFPDCAFPNPNPGTHYPLELERLACRCRVEAWALLLFWPGGQYNPCRIRQAPVEMPHAVPEPRSGRHHPGCRLPPGRDLRAATADVKWRAMPPDNSCTFLER